jgi:hypothetical protein
LALYVSKFVAKQLLDVVPQPRLRCGRREDLQQCRGDDCGPVKDEAGRDGGSHGADLSDHFCDGISPTCQSWTMPVKMVEAIGLEPMGVEGFQDR